MHSSGNVGVVVGVGDGVDVGLGVGVNVGVGVGSIRFKQWQQSFSRSVLCSHKSGPSGDPAGKSKSTASLEKLTVTEKSTQEP